MTLAGVLDYLPRGNLLSDADWRKRHRIVQGWLLVHIPALFAFGWWRGFGPLQSFTVVLPLWVCFALATVIRRRRLASLITTLGVVYSSAALVGLSHGTIEAHFHFFIIIGIIALYQDWVPFLLNIVFTVISHGVGSVWHKDLMFNHAGGQAHPWLWSGIHGAAVLLACIGMVIYWRTSEEEQKKALALTTQLSAAEVARRQFTSDLLVNLARRNQSLLYRQLKIINQLEEQERDPDALGELFRIDHLATRVRRNAESLLVLAGEDPPRVWSKPIRLVDVVRAAIAETEDLNRVTFMIDDRPAVVGRAVADLTHLLAELTENAARFSPPDTRVTIRSAPDPTTPGNTILAVEDWGIGMPDEDLAAANAYLARPRDIDLSVSQRLGLHVVARLAQRHGIKVSLTTMSGAGLTAVVVLPAEIFAKEARHIAPGLGQLAVTRAEAGWPEPMGAARSYDARGYDGRFDPRLEPRAEPLVPTGRYPSPHGPAPDLPPWRSFESDGTPSLFEPGAAQQLSGSRPDVRLPQDHSAFRSPTRPRAAWDTRTDAVDAEVVDVEVIETDTVVASAHPEHDEAAVVAARYGLARRRPQAHLAPELRRGSAPNPAPPNPAPPGTADGDDDDRSAAPGQDRAREALTRYQASRRAALRDTADDGLPRYVAGSSHGPWSR